MLLLDLLVEAGDLPERRQGIVAERAADRVDGREDVDLPQEMKRAMARQAEAERDRRAKVINAEGEYQAAEKMVQAAAMMSKEPIALQLRFLQTMREISSEHNTTTFLPIPIDVFTPFLNKGGGGGLK